MVLGRCRAALPISGGSIRPALAAWCRRSYASAACAYRLPDRARRARWPNGRASVRGCAGRALVMVVNLRPSPLSHVYDGRECLGHVLARGKIGRTETRNEPNGGLRLRAGLD